MTVPISVKVLSVSWTSIIYNASEDCCSILCSFNSWWIYMSIITMPIWWICSIMKVNGVSSLLWFISDYPWGHAVTSLGINSLSLQLKLLLGSISLLNHFSGKLLLQMFFQTWDGKELIFTGDLKCLLFTQFHSFQWLSKLQWPIWFSWRKTGKCASLPDFYILALTISVSKLKVTQCTQLSTGLTMKLPSVSSSSKLAS